MRPSFTSALLLAVGSIALGACGGGDPDPAGTGGGTASTTGASGDGGAASSGERGAASSGEGGSAASQGGGPSGTGGGAVAYAGYGSVVFGNNAYDHGAGLDPTRTSRTASSASTPSRRAAAPSRTRCSRRCRRPWA